MIRLSLVLLLLTGGAHAQAPDLASAAARIRADVAMLDLLGKTHEQRHQAIADLLAVATLLAPNPPMPLVDGRCSAASGVLSASVPAGILCSAGTASAVSANSVWSWSCAGSGGGTTAQCSAPCTPTQGTTP